jgi:uncharacterized membrane protein
MSDLRDRGGEPGAIDPEGDDFVAQFDREFGAPATETTTAVIDAPPTPPELDVGGDGHGDATPPSIEPPAADHGGPSLLARIGMRIIRRPYEWFRRPWPDDRVIRLAVTVSTLVVTTFIMMRTVHFRPILGDDLIFDDVTPTGGDMGAHVWAPAFLRDHLLPNFQLSGWSMDWYGGLPVYRFYMVVPALAMVALDVFLPYGVAFKLVAIFGLVTMPLMCWAFGRLARFRYPIPELFAFAGLCFVLNESTTIYGGNVLATMAGEFSFSIAVSLMMLGLGLLARGLEDGKGRLMFWASIVLALACLSHGIVLIYTAVGAVVIVACRSGADLWRLLVSRMSRTSDAAREQGLVYTVLVTPALVGLVVLLTQALDLSVALVVVAFLPGIAAIVALGVMSGWRWLPTKLFVKRLLYGASIGGLTLLLAAFWVGPFLFNHDYMTDMKYGFKPDGGSESFWSMLFDQEPFLDVVINTLAIVGLIAAIARRQVYGVALGLIGLIAVAMVYLTRDSLPVIGLLWNPRILPWVYLMRYLMMMIGAAEVAGVLVNWIRNRPAREIPGVGARSLIAGGIGLTVLVIFGFVFQVLPGGSKIGDQYAWGPIRSVHGMPDARSDGWPAYNFRGFESKPLYPEYHDVVQAMADLGADPEHGCGRALWEIDNRDGVGNGKYGTTMALMLLPFWTDGCIASMEGLYFEASGTTPYHFLTAAAMSDRASNPVRQLRYTDNDASVGVQHIHDLGIRYVLVTTPEAVAQADTRPELTKIATSGPWHIYEYADAAIVAPLDVQPVVVNGRDGDQRECYLEIGTSWFQHQDEWAAMPAVDGPDDWQRIDVAIDESRQEPQGQGTDGCGDPQSSTSRRVNIVQPVQDIDVVELPEVEVSNVDVGEQSVEFDVSEPGVPVLVRVSYFPNWTAHGAEGPYRIGPNQMVVVPTDTHVRLAFERSNSDLFFYGLTLIGIALAILARFRDWHFPNLARRSFGGPPLPPPSWSPGPKVGSSIVVDPDDDLGNADIGDAQWAPRPMPPAGALDPPPPHDVAPLAPALPPPLQTAGPDDRGMPRHAHDASDEASAEER